MKLEEVMNSYIIVDEEKQIKEIEMCEEMFNKIESALKVKIAILIECLNREKVRNIT